MAQKTQNPVAVNGSGGANVALTAQTFARYVEIQEDGLLASRQGLTVTWPDGHVDNYAPGDQPICIGNKTGALGAATGPFVGVPVYQVPVNVATQYCLVKSLTVTATSVRVTEWN